MTYIMRLISVTRDSIKSSADSVQAPTKKKRYAMLARQPAICMAYRTAGFVPVSRASLIEP